MDRQDFSYGFDTLLNSYAPTANMGEGITLDEYEKSFFLTEAQAEIVTSLYNGSNPYGTTFESTEESRRYLDNLVHTKTYSEEDRESKEDKVSANSVFYKLPDELMFITMEQVTFNDDSLGCYNGSEASVYPITQDEYSKIRKNPFRGATKYKVLRLDTGEGIVELISKYNIETYFIKYLSRPEPIILVDLPDGVTIEGEAQATECKLNPVLHKLILDRAVRLALASKGISINK